MDDDQGRVRTASSRLIARWILTAFLLTFLLARTLVLLIMTRRAPDLFLYLGQTHVHHLNYGIVLLAAVGAWLLFIPPREPARIRVAVIYGIGLALTFDEFGMWLHLGGSYWQRASYDAIVTIAGLLCLMAAAPSPRSLRPRQWLWAAAIAMALVLFAVLAADLLNRLGSSMERIEGRGPR
jgi:hypothetical protein